MPDWWLLDKVILYFVKFDLAYHRLPPIGIGHTFPVPGVIAIAIWLLKGKTEAISFYVGAVSHVISDTLDSVGCMLLYPFSTKLFPAGLWVYTVQEGLWNDLVSFYTQPWGLGIELFFGIWASVIIIKDKRMREEAKKELIPEKIRKKMEVRKLKAKVVIVGSYSRYSSLIKKIQKELEPVYEVLSWEHHLKECEIRNGKLYSYNPIEHAEEMKKLIDEADVVVGIIPSGEATMFELGYALAKNKEIMLLKADSFDEGDNIWLAYLIGKYGMIRRREK